ncbi:MAG: GSCFA domain-containing protein [Flammeovirgaceae bacterium]
MGQVCEINVFLRLMKPLRTELIPKLPGCKVSHSTRLLTMGSCFADAIGNQLLANKFTVSVNPFGTVYNPVSLHHLLNLTLNNQSAADNGFLVREDIHLHHSFHSQFWALSKEELTIQLQSTITEQHYWLMGTDVLLLTYGTAFVYVKNSTGKVVSNCHKVPSQNFSKKLLSVEDVVDSFKDTFEKLKQQKPNLQCVLTVSPVRHTKDGLEQNAVSKSVLRLACHRLQELNDVHYFPAFELMMDDLRDYRFYKTDRIHPTDEAEEYIGEKFADCFFDESTKKILNEWHEIKSALHHKPFQPKTVAHQAFLQNLLKRLTAISHKMNVQHELAELQSRLHD